MSDWNRLKKEALKDKIDKLDAQEHTQIYDIIKKTTDVITKTQNGVLVSADALDEKCLIDVENYVNFCLAQRKRMEDDLKTRKNYERMVS